MPDLINRAFLPKSEADVVDAVRWAAAGNRALAITGAGTKLDWGRPVAAAAHLSMTEFTGIDLYEPEELVLSARAGTPMHEIERRLAQHGQQLAFEPPDFGPLFGAPAGQGTLGGAIGCNLAGPRRIAAGAARDHVLGFSGVNGTGEAFKAGGRVVKNVTGFDLSKLLSGSFGTLAVLTQITLKVLPAPEESRTILVVGPDAAASIDIMGRALSSPHDVNGAAYLPGRIAQRSGVAAIAGSHRPVAALRIEGAAPSVAARAEGLRNLLHAHGDLAELSDPDSRRFWNEVRNVAPFVPDANRAIWHLSVPPASGARVAADIADGDDDVYFDWGGGRIWLASARDPLSAHERIRAAIAAIGGHATLMRASAAARAQVAVFQPPSPVEARLIGRLKDNFDPHRILNPGRMYEGI